MKKQKKAIDKVTVDRLNKVLTLTGILISVEILDKIIDAVELIEKHGGNTSLKHISKMEAKWEEHYNER